MLGLVWSLLVCASPRRWPHRSDVINEELLPTTVARNPAANLTNAGKPALEELKFNKKYWTIFY